MAEIKYYQGGKVSTHLDARSQSSMTEREKLFWVSKKALLTRIRIGLEYGDYQKILPLRTLSETLTNVLG